MITDTLKKMELVAKEIDSQKSADEIIESLKSESPPTDDLLDYYQGFVQSARKHLSDHKLVTVPRAHDLTFINTPPFARPTYPYAGYMGAAPFDTEHEGFFWVTPIDSDKPAELQEQQKRGHNQLSGVGRVFA